MGHRNGYGEGARWAARKREMESGGNVGGLVGWGDCTVTECNLIYFRVGISDA